MSEFNNRDLEVSSYSNRPELGLSEKALQRDREHVVLLENIDYIIANPDSDEAKNEELLPKILSSLDLLIESQEKQKENGVGNQFQLDRMIKQKGQLLAVIDHVPTNAYRDRHASVPKTIERMTLSMIEAARAKLRLITKGDHALEDKMKRLRDAERND